MAALAERQSQLRDQQAVAIAARTQARAQASASAESQQRLADECERMQARIVPSPEQMRRLLVELSQTVETLKKENMASNVVCRETQAKSDLLDKISGVPSFIFALVFFFLVVSTGSLQEQSLGKRIATMEELAADLARIRKLSKENKEHVDAGAQAESIVKEIEAHGEVCSFSVFSKTLAHSHILNSS